MKKNKGFVSLEVIIYSALAIFIITILMDTAINIAKSIESEVDSSRLNISKDSEEYEFLNMFIDMLYIEIDKLQETSIIDDTDTEIIEVNVEEYTEENQYIETSKLTIEEISEILGVRGFSNGKFKIIYKKDDDVFIVTKSMPNYVRKNSYYDYEIKEDTLVFERRRYYEFY